MANYRFFCDENDLALGRGLACFRHDVVHTGHDNFPEVPYGTPDPVWIPIVARLGLVVITRDQRIRRKPGELLAWKQAGLRGFVFTGAGQQPTWESVRVLARHWDSVERIVDSERSGPWMYTLTANSQPRPISL